MKAVEQGAKGGEKMSQEKLEAFAKLLEAEQIADRKEHGLDCEINLRNCQTRIKPGLKYTKVDVGDSGKYMVENATGNIYGIKAYGVIHKGHQYGTLDTIHDWTWGRYTARLKQTMEAPR